MHCKSLWIKASAKCINVNVTGLTHLSKVCYSIVRTGANKYFPKLQSSVVFIGAKLHDVYRVDCRQFEPWTFVLTHIKHIR